MKLREWISEYEKHTHEKFERNRAFELFYLPDKGFCELCVDDNCVFIWQLCGDVKYWIDQAKEICLLGGQKYIPSLVIRKPLPMIRTLGFRVYRKINKQGYTKYRCIGKTAQTANDTLTATQFGDSYVFTIYVGGERGLKTIKWDFQMFKKGSSSTSSYTPSAAESALQNIVLQNAQTAQSMPTNLLSSAQTLLNNNYGTANVDYSSLVNQAQNQISAGQTGLASLSNGQLPSAYLTSMQDAINSTLENTQGAALNNLANKGVLNSSVTSSALNDISKNAASTTAANYLNNISALSGINNSQISNANAGTNAAATGQQAALTPVTTLTGLAGDVQNNFITSPLSAMHQGSTTQTQNNGGSIWGNLATLGSGFLACFIAGTKINMTYGKKKNIEDIEVGDIVQSYPDKIATVLAINKKDNEPVVVLATESSEVTLSLTQPIMMDDGKYRTPAQMSEGMKTMQCGKIISIAITENATVYDLELKGGNNYIADSFVALSGSREVWGGSMDGNEQH